MPFVPFRRSRSSCPSEATLRSDVRVRSAERHPLWLGGLQCPGDRRCRGRLLDAALITALAFDLFQESFERGAWLSAIGLLLGAATFVAADELLDRYIEGASGSVSGFALLAGVTLDGIPENMALGVSLLETSGAGALTLLVAIFFSNLPEALGGAVGMRQQGRSRRFAIGVWSATAVVLAAAVVLGNFALSGMEEGPLAVLLSFAGGAVLASLADTLMPDAYREGGAWVALATTAGFLLSFLISEI
jgi:zinc transporter, ZIP family